MERKKLSTKTSSLVASLLLTSSLLTLVLLGNAAKVMAGPVGGQDCQRALAVINENNIETQKFYLYLAQNNLPTSVRKIDNKNSQSLAFAYTVGNSSVLYSNIANNWNIVLRQAHNQDIINSVRDIQSAQKQIAQYQADSLQALNSSQGPMLLWRDNAQSTMNDYNNHREELMNKIGQGIDHIARICHAGAPGSLGPINDPRKPPTVTVGQR